MKMKTVYYLLLGLCLATAACKPDEPEMPESPASNNGVTFTYDSITATLTIFGTGDMEDYSYDINAPWKPYWKKIQTVIIKDGVTSIGSWAFYNCSALTQVTIPESVTNIGYYAFLDCSALTQMDIPNSVTSINSWMFEGTALYDNADNWINNVLYVDNCLIEAKTELSGSYEITSGTRIIADDAFSGCSALTQVTIPDGVTSIGSSAFTGCSALAEMTVLATVPPTITASTFHNISTQVKVSIPEGSRDTYMADENWKQLLGLSAGELSGICGDNLTWTFTTADSTLTISGTGDMYDRDDLDQPWYNFRQGIKNISIQDGVESIGYRAFYYCRALMEISIGKNVTSIGKSAFYGTALYNNANNWINNVLYVDNCLIEAKEELSGSYEIAAGTRVIADWAFLDCSALTQVTIGNSVESIGNEAFWNCSALAQVTIGKGVESIGEYAFDYCSALAEMTVLATVPPMVGSLAFDGVSSDIPVYVPAESLEAYKAADGWKEFTNLQAIQ